MFLARDGMVARARQKWPAGKTAGRKLPGFDCLDWLELRGGALNGSQ